MQLQITQKGALYSAECAKCGASMFTHEWATWDHNEMRDAMENGTANCPECSTGLANPDTFYKYPRKMYAGRYSMPGYLDCTDWNYDANKRKLISTLRDYYGDSDT